MTSYQLKTRRKKLGLSQFAIAKSAKVSRYKISLYENEFGEFSLEEKERINNFLSKKEASHGITNQKVRSK